MDDPTYSPSRSPKSYKYDRFSEGISRHSSDQDSAELLPSLRSEPTHSKVFVRQPSLIYLQFLSLFSVALGLPLAFIGFTLQSGGIQAPQFIAEFSSSYPRLTPQITTAFSSLLTACVKWGLAGVVTIRAQKHFQHSRPMFKIEVYSALKNGGVAWSWKTRPWWTFWTFVVVVLCGLLTSGFVALISPLPIRTTKSISSGASVALTELDLASADSNCHQWYTQAIDEMYGDGNGNCSIAIRYRTSNLVYSTCRYVDPVGDVITAAKSSMLNRFEDSLLKKKSSDIIYSFTQLANTHLIGGTAGTLPTGPDGVHVLSEGIFPNISSTTVSYDYTLNLQGIWADISCSYANESQLSVNVTDETVSYQLRCPTGDTRQQYPTYNGKGQNGLVIAGSCYSKDNDTFTLHLRSFAKPSDYIRAAANSTSTQSTSAYAGIDVMTCALTPRIGDTLATYQMDRTAFKITPSNTSYSAFTKMSNMTTDIVVEGVYQVLASIELGQTLWNGNGFGEVVRNVAISYGNLTGQEKSPIVLNLVADAIKGIFEYRVTRQRLVLTAFVGKPPSESCYRVVSGSLTETMVGWDFKRTTALGLVPLWVISVGCLGVTIWTMMRRSHLTIFDPTNPISLVAAASNGKLRLSDEKDLPAIGDPEDEAVMNTRVIYGNHEGRWGLKAE